MVAIVAEEIKRVCTVCGVEKPIEEFQMTYRKWHLRICRECISLRKKEHYQKHREVVIATVNKYRQNNREAILKRMREYYQEHREALLTKMKEYHYRHWDGYYSKYQEVRKQRTREYYHGVARPRNIRLYGTVNTPQQVEQAKQKRLVNKELFGYVYSPEEREKQKRCYLMLRQKALELYGGKCECCGEARYDMLTFDHINSSGHKSGIRGVRLVYEVIKNG